MAPQQYAATAACLAAAAVLLMTAIAVSDRPRRESFLAALDEGVFRSVGLQAGKPSCVRVPSPLSPMDSQEDKERACSVICASQNGYNTMSRGPYMAANGAAVQCQCCDPSSTVTVDVELPKSAKCVPDRTFGIAGGRGMYAKNGCKGIFHWGDRSLVRCESEGLNTSTWCAYANGDVKLEDLQRAGADRQAVIDRVRADIKAQEDAIRAKVIAAKQEQVAAYMPAVVPAGRR